MLSRHKCPVFSLTPKLLHGTLYRQLLVRLSRIGCEQSGQPRPQPPPTLRDMYSPHVARMHNYTRNMYGNQTAHMGKRQTSQGSIGRISVAVVTSVAVVAVGRHIAKARRVFHDELAPRPLVEGAKDPHARGAPKPQQRQLKGCSGKR